QVRFTCCKVLWIARILGVPLHLRNRGWRRCRPRSAAGNTASTMTTVAIAWHSGYGHTRKLTEALDEGAASVPGVRVRSIDVAAIDAAGWEALAGADAIVFGAPTYMGGPSAPFKAFADATAKIWL